MNNILSLKSAAKLQKIVGIYKFLFVFFEFYVIFVDSRGFWTHIGIKKASHGRLKRVFTLIIVARLVFQQLLYLLDKFIRYWF